MKLSILIPAYNEEGSIAEILKEIESVDLIGVGIKEKEVILIDDGSTDRTVENARLALPSIKVIYHSKNLGKGAAVISGLSYAKGDIIIIQDADLEYHPLLYPILLAPILSGKTHVVYGSRFLDGHRPKGMRLPYFLANRFGTALINILLGTRLTDSMTCFKIFKKNVLEGVSLSNKGFGIDAELTIKIVKKGYKIEEVPIPYKARTFKEGKKFHPICSLNVLWAIIKYSI